MHANPSAIVMPKLGLLIDHFKILSRRSARPWLMAPSVAGSISGNVKAAKRGILETAVAGLDRGDESPDLREDD
jgi:hypothetical protein